MPIYPFWPAGVRLNATPAEGITGNLVYAREGKIEEILPKDVDGQIAVMECTGRGNWQQLAYFGARAILFLGERDGQQRRSADARHGDPVQLAAVLHARPANWPTVCGRGRSRAQVTLRSSANWEQKTAHNYYVLVKPREASIGAQSGRCSERRL